MFSEKTEKQSTCWWGVNKHQTYRFQGLYFGESILEFTQAWLKNYYNVFVHLDPQSENLIR